MARITVEDCLEKIDSQYDLVLLAKERTSQLNAGEKAMVPLDNDKHTVISLREIGEGKISIKTVEDAAINKLRKENIYPSHYDMRFVKPLDEKLLHHILKQHKFILTVEDGCVMGGFGSAILEFISDNNYKNSVQRLGIPDRVIEHGSQEELYVECNYDDDAIYRFSKKMLNFKNTSYKEVII